MDLSLTDEQEFLREAARGTLSRFKVIEAAHEALDGGLEKLPDLWPAAREAGWAGLLISEEHGGAGLGVFDAMLVAEETGRVLAPVPFLGLLPATAILDAAGDARCAAVAAGELRPVWIPTRPPGDLEPNWTVDGPGVARPAAPTIEGDGDAVRVTGHAAYVPDAPGADLLVVVGVDGTVAAVDAGADGVTIEQVVRYDVTRAVAHVTLDGAQGVRLAVDDGVVADAATSTSGAARSTEAVAADAATSTSGAARSTEAVAADAWYVAQALVAAETVGTVQTTLEMSVQYAKERFTFGRAIGSYQAIKHELTEVLRRLENSRSLLFYAGWARDSAPEEFALAASAARSAAGAALDFAARSNINVHGGIGATWEHDAPLYFRRAQLTRRLIGGHGDATDRVAERLLAA
ncbi:Acyl-CoA dehydrogenase [Baekduia alba]|uniref:acyl-CoA dehydrogenase family protein n=1 Tax=Baekduia alba TaxID=2997333 RepID=UPI00234253FE|nr:acyl-CoA dehydrogenase family protein [Baekduia alba]WCB91612.1 Acyl-CoA dehydrogenase [Baekduia alba]